MSFVAVASYEPIMNRCLRAHWTPRVDLHWPFPWFLVAGPPYRPLTTGRAVIPTRGLCAVEFCPCALEQKWEPKSRARYFTTENMLAPLSSASASSSSSDRQPPASGLSGLLSAAPFSALISLTTRTRNENLHKAIVGYWMCWKIKPQYSRKNLSTLSPRNRATKFAPSWMMEESFWTQQMNGRETPQHLVP